MNTNMPEENTIEVTADHVRALRTAGPGSLLVWHEPTGRVVLTEPAAVPDETMMIIAGHGDLKDVSAMDSFDEEDLAIHLSRMARVSYNEWPAVQVMTFAMVPIRRALTARSIYVDAAPTLRHSERLRRRWLRDEFVVKAFPRFTVQIMIAYDFGALGGAYPHDEPADVQLLMHQRLVERFAIEVDALAPSVAAEVLAGATQTVLEHTASM